MKTVIINKPHHIEVIDTEEIKLQSPNDVLIRVRAGGICGSDIHIYHGSNPFAEYPCIPGHEFAGEVIEVGENVTTHNVGDHVAIDPVISCGECYACKQGRYNVCESLQVRGVHTDGGFKELISIPATSAHIINKDIPFELATLVEPFTIAAQSTTRGDIREGDIVFIAGAGSIGLAILLTAKAKGCTVVISDLSDKKLMRAKECGADYIINSSKETLEEFVNTHDDIVGFTLALDAVGHPSILESILPVMQPTGRVVVLGFLTKPTNLIQMYITKKELNIVGSRLSSNKFPQVINDFETGKIDPSKIISHVLDYEEVEKGFDLLTKTPEDTCKVVLKF